MSIGNTGANTCDICAKTSLVLKPQAAAKKEQLSALVFGITKSDPSIYFQQILS